MSDARDTQRARVYAAEALVRTMFDRAAQRGLPTIEFFGAALTLPPEARFAAIPDVQHYVDRVLALPAVRQRWGRPDPLTVRVRRGVSAAHYEQRDGAAVIAVPDRPGDGWALRELVVLHEIAHHLCRTGPAHGAEFTTTLCELVETVLGPEAGHVLRVVYATEGVR